LPDVEKLTGQDVRRSTSASSEEHSRSASRWVSVARRGHMPRCRRGSPSVWPQTSGSLMRGRNRPRSRNF